MTPDTTPPTPRRDPRVVASAVIVFAGLGLILLGGCFLVGVVLIATTPTTTVSPLDHLGFLTIVLYGLAFACLGGALVLLVRGLRALFQVINEKSSTS